MSSPRPRRRREILDVSSKRVRKSVSDDTQTALDSIERQWPVSTTKRRVSRELKSRARNLVGELSSIVLDFRGEQDTEGAIARAADVMLTSMRRSWELGFVLGGVPDWELTGNQEASLVSFVATEVEFFRDFIQSLDSSEAMKAERRVELYGGSVEASLWHSWLSVLPSNASIDWRLSVAEHCPNCLELAARGPYGKPGSDNELPTVPRTGGTRCLGNCRCYLFDLNHELGGLVNQIGVEITAIAGLVVDPTAPGPRAGAALYQAMAEMHAYHQRMSSLTRSINHRASANNAKAQMRAMANNLGHTIRLTTSISEIMSPIDLSKSVGLRFVDPEDLGATLIGALAVVLTMNRADRGTVTSITSEPSTITLDDDEERTYRLDEIGRNILFLD